MSIKTVVESTLAIEHREVRFVDREIFLYSFAPDCTTHRCLCRDQNDRPRVDACCQHGADVLPEEKAAILRRAREVASVLKPERRAPDTWFDQREPDPDEPVDVVLRTATSDADVEDSGCVFLNHVGARGCGLHLAALEHGFDPAEIKPSVCRLYPLSLDGGRLGLNPDFDRYSCAHSGNVSIYSVMRGVLLQMFGDDLVRALDDAEARFQARRLRSVG
jgi:hypothetical protein